MMEHWREVKRIGEREENEEGGNGNGKNCNINMIELSYERLVEDPVGEVTSILSHLHLEGCEGISLLAERIVDSFHQQRRAVHTHSMTQVRQKVFKHSIGAWKKTKERQT